MSFARLLVGDRSGQVLDELTADIAFVNWRLNKVGKCEFVVATTDPKATFTNLRFGNFVYIDFSNGLPDWGGVIDPPRRWDERTIKVTAYSAEYLFGLRTTDKGRYFTDQTVGYIYKTLIEDANGIAATGITIGDVYDGGQIHSPEYHFKSLLDIFQNSLTARLSTNDFDVIPTLENGIITFKANFYESRGADRTGLALIQDKNLSRPILEEQGPIINSWDVAGEGSSWGDERLTANAQNDDSIQIYGIREDSKVYSDVSEQTTLDEHADTLLDGSKDPYNIFTLTALDTDPAGFGDYDIGDRLSLLAPDYGFGGTDTTIRILAREFEPGSGVCSLVVQEVV